MIYMLFFCAVGMGVCTANPAGMVYDDKRQCESEAARTNQIIVPGHGVYKCFGKPTWQATR